ncbi:MAG: peptide chain release factor H [Clostridiales bacterium]|jgi:peptide chain release factor|nr:peptide chain release factor H [Clostridiales bacterium]
MILQISSGNGPQECELAVGKFLEALKSELTDLEIVSEVKTYYAGCYRSVAISTNQNVSHLLGTIKWVAKSPFRPKHKRKNWFIDVSLFAEKPETDLSAGQVQFQTFHSRGHGGQNVNKVETGVRATHIPTGLSVTSTEARTQHLNKKIALSRLSEIIAKQNLDDKNLLKQTMWLQHELLERGNPVRIYTGMEFERKNA